MKELFVLFSMAAIPSMCYADSVTYAIFGVGSGEIYADDALGTGSTFSNQPWFVSWNTNTTNVETDVITGGVEFYSTLSSPGSMVLGTQSGQLGTPDLPSAFYTEHDFGSRDGFLDLYFENILPDIALTMTSPALAGYDLASNLGPIRVDSVLNPNVRIAGELWATTFGFVMFDSVSNVEFYSTVTTETPEPAGLGLTAGGLLLLAGTAIGRRIQWRLKSA